MKYKTIRRTYRAKTHYVDPTKPKTETHHVTCSRDDKTADPEESLKTVLRYRDEKENDAGYHQNDTTLTVGLDGHISFSDEDGEGFIYLYPEQVVFLRTILKASPRVHTKENG